MLRMNREKNDIQTFVKKNCANYNTDFICSGIMIDKQLNQIIDSEYTGKVCRIKEGKECAYYNYCVKGEINDK